MRQNQRVLKQPQRVTKRVHPAENKWFAIDMCAATCVLCIAKGRGLNSVLCRAGNHGHSNQVMRNQKCPWCREDVVWRSVFGFLDGLKKNIGKVCRVDVDLSIASSY